MDVTVEQQPDDLSETVVLVCEGNFGPGAVTALWATLEGMPDASTVIVDIAAVDSVDDHALRALLGTAHRLAEQKRLMSVNGAPPAIRTTLRGAGLHKWAALT